MSLDVYLTTPVLCPHCGGKLAEEGHEVFTRNITHNLNEMAEAAGIYEVLWQPDDLGITRAEQLIEPLKAGLERLRADPVKFQAFNPPNGWGSYAGLVEFVADYLAACEQNPQADVSAWR
jgi:hypothetical protein